MKYGAKLFVNSPVKSILTAENSETVDGLELEDGTRIRAKKILANADPRTTFLKLYKPKFQETKKEVKKIESFDHTSPVFKMNLALSELPKFICMKNAPEHETFKFKFGGPEHRGTTHLGAETLK
jgi:phytoene dehydrogenase-like protein